MLLVSFLTLGLCWRLTELFVVSQFGCGELLRFWYGEAPLGPTLLGIFTLSFTAVFCLWIIDLVRVRHRRPAIWVTSVQALLFIAILTVITTWSSFISPYSLFKPVSDSLRQGFAKVGLATVNEVLLEESSPDYLFWSTKPPAGLAFGPLVFSGRALSECSCMSPSETRLRDDLMWLEYYAQQGEVSLEDANTIRLETPKPVEPQWCEATMDIARRQY